VSCVWSEAEANFLAQRREQSLGPSLWFDNPPCPMHRMCAPIFPVFATGDVLVRSYLFRGRVPQVACVADGRFAKPYRLRTNSWEDFHVGIQFSESKNAEKVSIALRRCYK